MKNLTKSITPFVLGAILAAVGQSTARAQLVSYIVHSNDDGAPVAPTVTDPTTTTATDYSIAGSGLGSTGNLGLGVGPVSGSYATTLAGAETASDYYAFTVAPQAGYSLSLTTLDLSGARLYNGVTNGKNSEVADVALESSVTGFNNATPAATDGTFTIAAGTLTSGGPLIALDPTLFSDLTTPVQFRLYLYVPSGGGGAIAVPFDALTPAEGGDHANGTPIELDGTAVAPEPASYALLGLGLTTLVVSRYRRFPKV